MNHPPSHAIATLLYRLAIVLQSLAGLRPIRVCTRRLRTHRPLEPGPTPPD